ncbi:MAG: hypothetical protein GYA42_04295 [Syntrophomonadaceae bacterium]|nr:hypothetical protein [Syntrophomonadaceae bacterium]
MSWLVLLAVLYNLVTGRVRFDIGVFAGLVILGLLRVAEPQELFSGFANPALFTVAVVLVMSAGLVESGILTGLGQGIARRLQDPRHQIFALSMVTGLLSTLMNNIGAIGLILPTAQRMASRAQLDKGIYGMPLVYACILGGSITLIGTSGNIIVASFRRQALGEPFRMFDFAPHGLAMAGAGLILWLISYLAGSLKKIEDMNRKNAGTEEMPFDLPPSSGSPRTRKNTAIVLVTMIPVVFLASWGLIHPAVGFSLVVLIMMAAGILKYEQALESLNLPVIIFIGCMLSLTQILQSNGALALLITPLHNSIQVLPPFWLVFTLVAFTALLANILDNSVAAVMMAPSVTLLYQSGGMNLGLDAMLMAVAAGASLGIVVPSHQVTLVAMLATGFSPQSFMKSGAVICCFAMLAAALVITRVWA